MEQCSECRFWLNWDSEMTNLGECHRFPPRMATRPGGGGDDESVATVRPEDGGWPLTSPTDWCGEFQPPPTRPGSIRPASSQRGTDAGPAGI